MKKLANAPEKIANLLELYLQSKEISKYHVCPTYVKRLFECHIFFLHSKLSGSVELEVSFLWNLSKERYENNNKKQQVFQGDSDFDSFFRKQIENRTRGEINEIRILKISKEIVDISPNLKVLSVDKGSEYADNKLKIDLWFKVNYDYRGKFDGSNSTCCFLIGIQIKSSKKGQDFHKKMHPFIPSIVAMDYMSDEQVKNILHNLLKNACKFKVKQLYAMLLKEVDSLHSKDIIEDTEKGLNLEINELHL